MNAKNLKFMQSFEELVKSDIFADRNAFIKRIKAFIALDYTMAVSVWDYIATTREDAISKDSEKADTVGQKLFSIFYAESPAKCIKALSEAPAIRRAFYQFCPASCQDAGFMIMTDLMVAGKVEAADEILKCVVKNEKIDFGPLMKKTLERVFIELLKKNPAKIEMSKKLSAMLLSYVKRIKTDERAMLEQRLREIQ